MVDGRRLFDGCSPDATLRIGFASLVCISIVKWAHNRLHKCLMNEHMHSKRIPCYRSVMYKLHLQCIYTDLILFSFLPSLNINNFFLYSRQTHGLGRHPRSQGHSPSFPHTELLPNGDWPQSGSLSGRPIVHGFLTLCRKDFTP